MTNEQLQVEVVKALKTVQDPDLHKDIVSLGFVKNMQVNDGHIRFDVELTTPACPVKERLKTECETKTRALPGVKSVEVSMTAVVRATERQQAILTGVKNIVAVASGKGGVGKSTVAVNLALALQLSGAKVGLMDADIYGPSVPQMLGIPIAPPHVVDSKMFPHEKYGMKVISAAFLAKEGQPLLLRGPMLGGIIQQFLQNVEWGELDYLVIDLPPGTGDVQMTLTQRAPISGAVIVTTPQEVSLIDAEKGVKMFFQVNVPVLGIVENMSYFTCETYERESLRAMIDGDLASIALDAASQSKVRDLLGKILTRKQYVFKNGGGKTLADRLQVPYIGDIPLIPQVVTGGDCGKPVIMTDPDSPASKAYRDLAGKVAAQLSINQAKEEQVDATFALEWKS